MRTLVIPDIHHRFVSAQRLIDTVPHDKVILLGDYFDSFGDTYHETSNTAIWLRELVLTNPKIVPLIGNHDTHYFWPMNHTFTCSGYTDMKRDAVRKELNDEHFSKFRFYHIDQGFMFTHAGLDNRMFKQLSRNFTKDEQKTKLDFVDDVLSYWFNIVVKNKLHQNEYIELLGAGWDRGGRQPVGGINWVDFSSLSPIQGVNQIVGHTPHPVPDVKIQKQGGAISVKTIFEFYNHEKFPPVKDPLSINYAIDTHSKHYAVIEDGVIQVWDIMHNMKVQDFQNFAIPESSMNFF